MYRCSTLNPPNFQFILTLGLQVIITLNADKPSKALRTVCAENHVDLIHLGIQPWRSTQSWLLFSKDLLQDALAYILDRTKHPILVVDSSSAFMGMLRSVQHWTYSSIVSEYRTYAGAKTHYMTEIFLEMLEVRCVRFDEYAKAREQFEVEKKERVKKLQEKAASKQQPYPDDFTTKILLRSPVESVLPDWYVWQRSLWEREHTLMA